MLPLLAAEATTGNGRAAGSTRPLPAALVAGSAGFGHQYHVPIAAAMSTSNSSSHGQTRRSRAGSAYAGGAAADSAAGVESGLIRVSHYGASDCPRCAALIAPEL